MPAEVRQFEGHHDIARVTIPSDPDEYSCRWINWWLSVQPKWRLTKNLTLPMKDDKSLPLKPDWRKLSISGENGIVLAIAGLAIWSISLGSSTRNSRNRFLGQNINSALKDVNIVLQMMAVNWMKESEEIAPNSKRARK